MGRSLVYVYRAARLGGVGITSLVGIFEEVKRRMRHVLMWVRCNEIHNYHNHAVRG